MIRPEDELFHPPGNDPYWNESGWFQFMIPERKLNGWICFYHRPNMNLSAGGVALWDPSGEHPYDCLYYQWDEHLALPTDANMHDFTLDNGLTVECVEPLVEYRTQYKQIGCELDLHWTAVMEPHEQNPTGTGRVNPGIEHFSTNHYDQCGRLRGTINVEGEELEIDCLSMRDHSWGRRHVTSDRRRAAYEFGFASETSSFHANSVSDLPIDDDPILGTTERIVAGWYMRDGVLGSLVSGERRVLERSEEDGRPLRHVINALDDLGRTLHAEGTMASGLKWHGYNVLYTWWGLARWEFDGNVGWGEEDDYWVMRHNRRFMQALRAGNT